MNTFAHTTLRILDPARVALLDRADLIGRLEACGTCEHRRNLNCSLATANQTLTIRSVMADATCPANLWPQRSYGVEPVGKFRTLGVCPARKTRVLILLHDLAQGGIARYTVSLVAGLSRPDSPVEVRAVIFRRGYHFDPEAAWELSRFCKVYGAEPDENTMRTTYGSLKTVEHLTDQQLAYQNLIDESDVVTTAGLHGMYSSLPDGLDFRGKPVLTQVHGCCEWTRKSMTYSGQFATEFIAVSQAAKVATEIAAKGKPMTVVDSGIDLNRLVTVEDRYTIRKRFLMTGDHQLDLDPGVAETESPWVMYFGRFAPDKQIPKSAEVVAALIEMARNRDLPVNPRHYDRLSKTVMLLSGDGYDAVNQMNAVRQIIPNRYVRVPWQLPAAPIRAADIALNLSEAEGGPLTVAEALASAVPVISTPVGFVPNLNAPVGDAMRLACTPVSHTEAPYEIARKLAWQLSLRKATGERSHDDCQIAMYVARRFGLNRFGDDWIRLIQRVAPR